MKHTATRKLVLTAMMACLAFVLNTFVYFPAMAPFQHFVDVVAAVFLGPWYACAAAFLCGVMRMMSGRTIQAVAGAVFAKQQPGNSIINAGLAGSVVAVDGSIATIKIQCQAVMTLEVFKHQPLNSNFSH